jgi:DegV family protein with EDD domain
VRVRQALEQTRGQLEELRAADVVDAGAQGFVDMLEGMLRFLQTGDKGETTVPVHEGEEAMAGTAPVAAGEDFRYCTECLVTAPAGGSIELRGLRESLSSAGSSVVVSGSTRKAKIHIHCDDPDAIFRLAGGFGEVQGQKADDMRMQQSAAHHRRAQRVAVVTDSGSDLPDADMERLGIHMVAARVNFGGRSYLDKVSMTSAEFFKELGRNPEHPKTSQPPPGDFRRIFEFLVSHYESVVSVNLTARHSGTYNAAATVAQRVSAEGRRVVVIDTRNASVGEALVVLAAAEAAAAGQDIGQVIAVAEAARDRTQTFALVERIDFAVRGGRVPAIVGTIARWLRLNVILRTFPDGRVAFGGGLFGPHRRLKRFIRFVLRRSGLGEGTGRLRVLVGHADRQEAGRELYEGLLAAIPSDRIAWSALTDMGAAIGVHAGPGTLIVAVQRIDG